MSDEIKLEENEFQFALSVRFQCAPKAMASNLAKILPVIYEYILMRNGEVAGSPFLRYHGMAGGRFFLEAGIPVTSAIAGNRDIEATELPDGKVVVGTHVGPYPKIGDTHKRIRAWIADKKLTTRAPAWDSYIDNPNKVDEDELRTRIFYPVK